MKIDLEKIQSRLFENETVRARILKDFGIAQNPVNARHFVSLVVDALKQPVAPQPLQQAVTNGEMFEAAVRALGSNSRNWCHFLRNETQIRILLEGYDPQAALKSFHNHPDILNKIESHLVGQTSSQDAQSMFMWALILSKRGDFYKEIVRVSQKLRDDYKALHAETLDDSDLALCIVGHFANESCSGAFKFPGMRYILASEFLKNLGWSCFKPDRHVQRLFDKWFGNQNAALINQEELVNFESLILGGKEDKELRTFLEYSMLGKTVSPAGSSFSQVDNMVWLLGKYIEKKGKETSTVYVSAI
jgi:hypothetical protein